MRILRSIVARVREWYNRIVGRQAIVMPSFVPALGQGLLRDVTPNGVRVYSLCGGCGARLECSATLCEECAQGPHTSTF
jgi:hypothetical protein